jgi:hypothetical protein
VPDFLEDGHNVQPGHALSGTHLCLVPLDCAYRDTWHGHTAHPVLSNGNHLDLAQIPTHGHSRILERHGQGYPLVAQNGQALSREGAYEGSVIAS